MIKILKLIISPIMHLFTMGSRLDRLEKKIVHIENNCLATINQNICRISEELAYIRGLLEAPRKRRRYSRK